jgi:hypothetical protein
MEALPPDRYTTQAYPPQNHFATMLDPYVTLRRLCVVVS